MLVAPKRYARFLLYRLLPFEYGVGRERKDDAAHILLGRYDKGPDSLVLFAYIDLLLFHLGRLSAHLLGYQTHFAPFLCEKVRLILILLNFFRKLSILTILALDACSDVSQYGVVGAGILLNRVRVNVEIEDTRSKGIEKVCVVRNNNAGLRIFSEKCREMFDTCGIEIIRGLV